MKTTICDRCGKVIPKDVSFVLFGIYVRFFAMDFDGGDTLLDLCKTCYKKVVRFARGKMNDNGKEDA